MPSPSMSSSRSLLPPAQTTTNYEIHSHPSCIHSLTPSKWPTPSSCKSITSCFKDRNLRLVPRKRPRLEPRKKRFSECHLTSLKTMATLKSTIKQVRSVLHDARKVPKPSSSFQSRVPNATPVLRAAGDDKQAASTSIKQGLVSDKMKAQVTTLRDMTNRASPIIDVFTKLSVRTFLSNQHTSP
jgi:hypothetical protein